jgi:hypothetical protein
MGTQDVGCGRNGGAPPASWTFPPLQGISKDLAFETVSTRRCGYAPLLRFLMPVTAGSDEGR